MTVLRTRRPRARRVRRSDSFDAKQVFLEDHQSKNPEQWRLAAVLKGLEQLATSAPPASPESAIERRSQMDGLIACAEQRGLERIMHIEPWLRQVVAGAVFAHVIASQRDDAEVDFELAQGWSILAREYLIAKGSDESAGEALGALVGSIYRWAMSVDADDLLNWKPAGQGLFDGPTDLPNLRIDDEAAWLIERFTATYLDEWSTPALRMEWLYLHGQIAGPCSSSDMRGREVEEAALAKEIADRFAADTPSSPGLATRLVEPAIRFIGEGRRTEAAALFEAAAFHEPRSFRALNNLGFCLLPDDAARALRLFDQAIATGHADTEVARVNRILALAVLGRHTSAIDSAEAFLTQISPVRQDFSAWLWDVDSILRHSQPQLVDCRDSQDYVTSVLEAVKNRVADGAQDTSDCTWN
ncbi:MAG: hypothetical protein OXB99_02200 [Acidimicrobiaceae bacterium]|nr:hypothetical protein [Acidimicrobiaceae bacterium]